MNWKDFDISVLANQTQPHFPPNCVPRIRSHHKNTELWLKKIYTFITIVHDPKWHIIKNNDVKNNTKCQTGNYVHMLSFHSITLCQLEGSWHNLGPVWPHCGEEEDSPLLKVLRRYNRQWSIQLFFHLLGGLTLLNKSIRMLKKHS